MNFGIAKQRWMEGKNATVKRVAIYKCNTCAKCEDGETVKIFGKKHSQEREALNAKPQG